MPDHIFELPLKYVCWWRVSLYRCW